MTEVLGNSDVALEEAFSQEKFFFLSTCAQLMKLKQKSRIKYNTACENGKCFGVVYIRHV